jgi:hypothetical protein
MALTGGTDAGVEYRQMRTTRAWPAGRREERAGAENRSECGRGHRHAVSRGSGPTKKGPRVTFFDAIIEAIESGDRQAISGQLPPMLKIADEASRDALRAPALVQQADRSTRAVLQFCLTRALTCPGLEAECFRSHPPTESDRNEQHCRPDCRKIERREN